MFDFCQTFPFRANIGSGPCSDPQHPSETTLRGRGRQGLAGRVPPGIFKGIWASTCLGIWNIGSDITGIPSRECPAICLLPGESIRRSIQRTAKDLLDPFLGREIREALRGKKEGRISLSPDPRIGRKGRHHLKPSGPRTGRWILMPLQIPSSSDEGILECMGTRRPRQRTLPRKGPQSREVSFLVRYPNPCKNPSGIFQDRYLHDRSRKKGPSGPFLKDRPPVMSEWPPSGAPSLGPIPGTESPRNRERDPNLGLVGSVCLSSGPGSPGKPPAASYEVCRCCKGQIGRASCRERV